MLKKWINRKYKVEEQNSWNGKLLALLQMEKCFCFEAMRIECETVILVPFFPLLGSFFFGLLRISLFIYFPRKITKAISPHLHTWKISKTQNFFPKMVFNRIIMLFKFLYVFICLARFENFVFGYMFDYIHCQHSFYRTINAAFELETLKPHLRYDQKSKCT